MNKFEKYWMSVKDHYFDYNGVRYYAGTRFMIMYKGMPRTAHFVSWRDDDHSQCVVEMVYPWPGRTVRIWVPIDEMSSRIVEITEGNHYVETNAKIRYFKDSDIPELFFGWIAYIAIMLVLFIFKDRWVGWIAVSCYFFWWRSKVKEENIYTEGD